MDVTSATLFLRLKQEGPPWEVAWTEFRARYAPIIAGFAKNLGVPAQEIDDLIQDVMTGFYSAQPRFSYQPQRGRFRGYLKTCVTNLLSDRRAKRRMQTDGRLVEEIDVADDSIDVAWEAAWQREHLQRALALLQRQYPGDGNAPNRNFEAFHRVAIDGHETGIVADELDMSLDNVYLATSRCLARLRLILKQLESEEG